MYCQRARKGGPRINLMAPGQLVDDLLDGTISKDDFGRLEALLESDAGARATYYDRLHLHSALEISAEESPIIAFPSQKRSRWLWVARMAAAIAVLGSVAWIGWFSGRSNEVVLAEPAASGFAVIADQANATYIIDGEIEQHTNNEAICPMKEGESMRWNANGHMEALPFASQSVADIEAALSQQRDERRTLWQMHAETWKEDPRVVAYFPMVQPSTGERQLVDMSSPSHHGTIVRAAQVADRWGHSQAAPDFAPMGSRVRVVIPEELHALTFYCWVKIDSLDRWYNSLFLTDGHELNEPHWQIMNDGRIFFSVKAHNDSGGNDKQICYSPSFWDPSLSGQWIQLATSFDSNTGQVVHYVNGRPISEVVVRDAMRVDKIRIGAASIGNWSEPERNDPHFAVRNLNGSIDEFILFNAALSAAEIDQLYQAGKP